MNLRLSMARSLAVTVLLVGGAAVAAEPPANPLIDAAAFQQIVAGMGTTRETRRLDEQAFLAEIGRAHV